MSSLTVSFEIPIEVRILIRNGSFSRKESRKSYYKVLIGNKNRKGPVGMGEGTVE